MKRLLIVGVLIAATSSSAIAGGCPGPWSPGCSAAAGTTDGIRIELGWVEFHLTNQPSWFKVEHLGHYDLTADYFKCGESGRLEDIHVGDDVIVTSFPFFTQSGGLDWDLLVEDFTGCEPTSTQEGRVGAIRVTKFGVAILLAPTGSSSEGHWTRVEPRNDPTLRATYYRCGRPTGLADIQTGDSVSIAKRLIGKGLEAGYQVKVEDSSGCEPGDARRPIDSVVDAPGDDTLP